MAKRFLYEDSENHVEKRSGLSPDLRSTMFEIPRSKWADDPRFHGEPAFWLDIHRGLLSGSDGLAQWSEAFCGDMPDEARVEMAGRMASLGRRLVHHAHGHHHIEDRHFFPAFLQLFPQLAHPLELLDGDHRILGEVLDELEGAVSAFPVRPTGSDKEKRDQWLANGETLQRAARRLDNLFRRHIHDEEEICVPAMLRLG